MPEENRYLELKRDKVKITKSLVTNQYFEIFLKFISFIKLIDQYY